MHLLGLLELFWFVYVYMFLFALLMPLTFFLKESSFFFFLLLVIALLTTVIECLNQGVTAVLNFQSGVEAENWGINSKSINESCQGFNILMINYPIRYLKRILGVRRN